MLETDNTLAASVGLLIAIAIITYIAQPQLKPKPTIATVTYANNTVKKYRVDNVHDKQLHLTNGKTISLPDSATVKTKTENNTPF